MKRKSWFIVFAIIIFMLVACDKPDSETEGLNIIDGEDITDIDGNVYKTVKIGDQVWMAENLKVTHYRDSSSIGGYSHGNSSGAYCAYDDDENNVETYGLLYNWYAVDDTRNIAPEGWHVSTDADWLELESLLGIQRELTDVFCAGLDAGDKLKATSGWPDPDIFSMSNGNGSNTTHFSALPGGYRGYYSFNAIGESSSFWTSTERVTPSDDCCAWHRELWYDASCIFRGFNEKNAGSSVRCVKD